MDHWDNYCPTHIPLFPCGRHERSRNASELSLFCSHILLEFVRREGFTLKRLLRSLVVIEDCHFGEVVRFVNAASVNIMAEEFRGTNRLPFCIHEGCGSQAP